MNSLVIDRKKYVLLSQRDYDLLLQKAALKRSSARKLSLEKGRKLALSLVDKWHKEK